MNSEVRSLRRGLLSRCSVTMVRVSLIGTSVCWDVSSNDTSILLSLIVMLRMNLENSFELLECCSLLMVNVFRMLEM